MSAGINMIPYLGVIAGGEVNHVVCQVQSQKLRVGEILRKENTGAASVHVGLANLGRNFGSSLVQPVQLAVLGIHCDGNRSPDSLVSPVIAQDSHPLLSLPVPVDCPASGTST